jgi:DNA-binding response OmpR family regulator
MRRKILLIEDDQAVADSLCDALQRDGYSVTHHTHGESGMAYAHAQAPHLVVLDVRLPDGSGLDFCRQMRQNGVHQPILILTVRDAEIDKVLGLEMGADDYVTKPFGIHELLSRVRALMRRAYGELALDNINVLYAGDLVIDRGRAVVRRGDHPIYLTPVEFRLLVYLAQHPGQALTREQILDGVWGYDPTPESDRAINTHIRRLREKIEPDPSDPTLIQTVLGVGYRLAF